MFFFCLPHRSKAIITLLAPNLLLVAPESLAFLASGTFFKKLFNRLNQFIMNAFENSDILSDDLLAEVKGGENFVVVDDLIGI